MSKKKQSTAKPLSSKNKPQTKTGVPSRPRDDKASVKNLQHGCAPSTNLTMPAASRVTRSTMKGQMQDGSTALEMQAQQQQKVQATPSQQASTEDVRKAKRSSLKKAQNEKTISAAENPSQRNGEILTQIVGTKRTKRASTKKDHEKSTDENFEILMPQKKRGRPSKNINLQDEISGSRDSVSVAGESIQNFETLIESQPHIHLPQQSANSNFRGKSELLAPVTPTDLAHQQQSMRHIAQIIEEGETYLHSQGKKKRGRPPKVRIQEFSSQFMQQTGEVIPVAPASIEIVSAMMADESNFSSTLTKLEGKHPCFKGLKKVVKENTSQPIRMSTRRQAINAARAQENQDGQEDDIIMKEIEEIKVGELDKEVPATTSRGGTTSGKLSVRKSLTTSSILPSQMQHSTLTQQILLKQQVLNPHLYKRGPTKYQKASSDFGLMKGHWTKEEDLMLGEAVKKHGGKNWKKIAESLPGRTDVQCLHRWQKVLNPSLVKGPWTEEEDRLVLQLVQTHGPQKWTQIAEHLPGRIGKQCRERWHNHLNPKIKKIAWSDEEEWILFLYHTRMGNKWADIAKVLDGRTDNTIKNHWNSSMKKRIPELLALYDIFMKDSLSKRGITYQGNNLSVLQQATQSYQKAVDELDKEIIQCKLSILQQQNKEYFSAKAREIQELCAMIPTQRSHSAKPQRVKRGLKKGKTLKLDVQRASKSISNLRQAVSSIQKGSETMLNQDEQKLAQDLGLVQITQSQIQTATKTLPPSNLIKIELGETRRRKCRGGNTFKHSQNKSIIQNSQVQQPKNMMISRQQSALTSNTIITPESNKENMAPPYFAPEQHSHFMLEQGKLPPCCAGLGSTGSDRSKLKYQALMSAYAHCSQFRVQDGMDDNYKPNYMQGLENIANHINLAHLLEKDMKEMPLMNTPPANGNKTISKLHIGSTNHRGRGLFSCTPKNEVLNFAKDDGGFRRLNLLTQHQPLTSGAATLQRQMSIQKNKQSNNPINILLQTPPYERRQPNKENEFKLQQSPQEASQCGVGIASSGESIKQGSQTVQNLIKCPKPSASIRSPIHHPQLQHCTSMLSLQRSNSRNKFQHEQERSAFRNIATSYQSNPKMSLQFTGDLLLPPPLLPMHSSNTQNDFQSPTGMLRCSSKLQRAPSSSNLNREEKSGSSSGMNPNKIGGRGRSQNKGSSGDGSMLHLELPKNLQGSSSSAKITVAELSRDVLMHVPPIVDMHAMFLKTPAEGDSILGRYYATNTASADGKIINVSPFFTKQ